MSSFVLSDSIKTEKATKNKSQDSITALYISNGSLKYDIECSNPKPDPPDDPPYDPFK